MAQRVLARLQDFETYELAAVVSITPPDDVQTVTWAASLEELNASVDLLIDFTLPGGTRDAAQWCEKNGVAMLSGTTGLTVEDITALKNASLKVPVLWAPNMSHGVALMNALVRRAASAMGLRANIKVTDVHHIHKVDAPSGTALALAKAVKTGQSQLAEHRSASSQPETSAESDEHKIIFDSVREGEVIGEHTVSFALLEEIIEITHKALDRDVFANGALKAGEWLLAQAPGYYSTSDWLGLD
jgi:4-hydroxy-tetrahydrodipicolinate reductase